MSAEEKDLITSHVKEIEKMAKMGASGALMNGYLAEQGFDSETKLALWSRLPSQVRTPMQAAARTP